MCKSLNKFSILVGTGFANDGEAFQANFNRLDQCLDTFWIDLTPQNRSRIGVKIFEQFIHNRSKIGVKIGPKLVSKSERRTSLTRNSLLTAQSLSKIDPESVSKSIQNRSRWRIENRAL